MYFLVFFDSRITYNEINIVINSMILVTIVFK